MLPTQKGSLKLFRFAGIDVYLHWSWFLLAVYGISLRQGQYSSMVWNVYEYLALFAIVLMHEFGHSLACRSVGGRADQIILWPLGGVAYVDPPQRPGPVLWSIVAGPLVNVILVPVLSVMLLLSRSLGWPSIMPDTYKFIYSVWGLNLGLLTFNILPIFPLDGGQILRALLWFPLGRARSLITASIIGFVGLAGLIALVAWDWFSASNTSEGGKQTSLTWPIILCVFVVMNCGRGLVAGLAMLRADNMPRRSEFACPACKAAPPVGAFWVCGKCQKPFDTFATGALCPQCGIQYPITGCPDCRVSSPIDQWVVAAPVPPKL
ncbi:MAG: peptidase [Pedosphaera sp.]|nr:peptidase [Pedosphaera sp.]